MSRQIEKYLSDVKHYLVTDEPKEDILAEIRAHIQERLDEEKAGDDEETVKRILEEYGDPQEVAARYSENKHIIAPHYRNHLFMYTGIVFAIHLGLYLLSLIVGRGMWVLPYGDVTVENVFQLVSMIPQAFVFDFGLVALILYFITQSGAKVRLGWPEALLKKEKKASLLATIVGLVVQTVIVAGSFTIIQSGVLSSWVERLSEWEVGSDSIYIVVSEPAMYYTLLIIGGLFAINLVTGLIKLLERSELINVISGFAGLTFMWFVASRLVVDAVFDVSEELNAAISIGFRAFLSLIAVVIIIDLIIHIIRYWAKKVVKENP